MKPITSAEYGKAVNRLLSLAIHDTSGGRAAAQVLLGVYNGYEFHCDLTDLCLLDDGNLAAALTVIQGRAQLRQEPHEVVIDGDKHFQRVLNTWAHLSVFARYADHYQEARCNNQRERKQR